MTLYGSFYDVILFIDHVSLMLDGVRSFLCVVNIRHTCKRSSYSQTCGGISSVHWQDFFSAVVENWKNLKDTTAFSWFLVC